MTYQSQNVPAGLLLIWVLAVSSAFQTYRAKHMWYIEKQSPAIFLKLMILGVHVVVHVIIAARIGELKIEHLDGGEKAAFIIALMVTCVGILVFPHKYNNSGPDFGRWLEYMLTAPIQIVIIAMSVWLRDRSTLFALGAAQACMLLCGVVIEGNLQRIYENNEHGEIETHNQALLAARNEDDDEKNEINRQEHVTKKRANHEAIATLVIAWVTFALIWYVIITQFNRQTEAAGQCDQGASLPPVCPKYISNPTFITETTHNPYYITVNGITTKVENTTTVTREVPAAPAPPCKACPVTAPNNMCQIIDSKCAGRSVIPPAVFFIVYIQCLIFGLFGVILTFQLIGASHVKGPDDERRAWYSVSKIYAVLSVTAKTSLEVGFLVMLSQMPESVLSE